MEVNDPRINLKSNSRVKLNPVADQPHSIHARDTPSLIYKHLLDFISLGCSQGIHNIVYTLCPWCFTATVHKPFPLILFVIDDLWSTGGPTRFQISYTISMIPES